MSLYYFNFSNGETVLDDIGTELSNLAAVRKEAVLISRELILPSSGECPSLWDGVPSKVWVTDGPASGGGGPFYRLKSQQRTRCKNERYMPELTNMLLNSLSVSDAAAIRPRLKRVHLKSKQVLFEAGGTIKAVYFPVGAVISLVIGLASGALVEAAMVGRDGVVGASSALDGNISLSHAIVKLEGDSLMCEVDALRGCALQSQTFLATLIRHEQTLFAQAQQSTACMANHEVEERLCRWLLRARDLCGSDTLKFTQEFIAEMLGVRRTSVTLAAKALQQSGLIRYHRGHIQILDLEGLRESACECYQAVKDHYALLIGPRY